MPYVKTLAKQLAQRVSTCQLVVIIIKNNASKEWFLWGKLILPVKIYKHATEQTNLNLSATLDLIKWGVLTNWTISHKSTKENFISYFSFVPYFFTYLSK